MQGAGSSASDSGGCGTVRAAGSVWASAALQQQVAGRVTGGLYLLWAGWFGARLLLVVWASSNKCMSGYTGPIIH